MFQRFKRDEYRVQPTFHCVLPIQPKLQLKSNHNGAIFCAVKCCNVLPVNPGVICLDLAHLTVVIWIIDAVVSSLLSQWLMACVPKSFSPSVIPPSPPPFSSPFQHFYNKFFEWFPSFHPVIHPFLLPCHLPCVFFLQPPVSVHPFDISIIMLCHEMISLFSLALFPAFLLHQVLTLSSLLSSSLPLSLPANSFCHFLDISEANFWAKPVKSERSAGWFLVVVNVNFSVP